MERNYKIRVDCDDFTKKLENKRNTAYNFIMVIAVN